MSDDADSGDSAADVASDSGFESSGEETFKGAFNDDGSAPSDSSSSSDE
ncbi:hypothetical protein [Halopenitus persicus]|nr:hypothetical protein [Halopenitus persicus]